MSKPNDPSDNPTAAAPRGPAPVPGRRRLLQGGLAATPVLLTFISRPVLGQVTCQSMSAFLSANASRPGGNLPVCNGRAPEFWISNADQWPAPYVGKVGKATVVQSMEEMDHDGTGPRVETQPEVAALNADKGPQPTKFHSAVTGCHGHFFGSKPMMEVMQMQGGGMYDFARHICAALLNSAAGLTPVLDETAVRTMWNEYVNRGYVEPTAGVKWSCDDCVEYLQSTMT